MGGQRSLGASRLVVKTVPVLAQAGNTDFALNIAAIGAREGAIIMARIPLRLGLPQDSMRVMLREGRAYDPLGHNYRFGAFFAEA
jgi:hypothetical protein